MQASFQQHHALQCSFCTSGMVLSAIDLLQRNPHPTDGDIRAWLKGNFCRCTGYQHIVDAIRAAAETQPIAADLSTSVSIAREEHHA